jgi:hypothetical protein
MSTTTSSVIQHMAARARPAQRQANTRSHGVVLDMKIHLYADDGAWVMVQDEHGRNSFGAPSTERLLERLEELVREVQAQRPDA